MSSYAMAGRNGQFSRALQESHTWVQRHVSRNALNYMHAGYLKIDLRKVWKISHSFLIYR